MNRFTNLAILLLVLTSVASCTCYGLGPHETHDLIPRDTQSLLLPSFKRSEIVGLVAGFGTTFAALPDLIAMLRRRSSAGVNPRMATIMGAFQILWVYYGLLIASRPVIIWNVIAVFVNFINVCAYLFSSAKRDIREQTAW